MNQPKQNLPFFVKGDIDGFFGLMIDNLIQFILIGALCTGLLNFPKSLVFGKILPGAAISILFGNLFYAWQARKLMQRTGRTDVTALPYGINTVSLFAFIFFIMLPVYQQTKSVELAWQMGLVACFLSGVIELIGAFVATKIRRYTPRAALLSALAGIALTFIAMDFTLKTFEKPIIAFIPLVIILVHYFAKVRFPGNIPGGLLAIIVGTALAWFTGGMSWENVTNTQIHLSLPQPTITTLFEALTNPLGWKYLSIIIPMGLFNVIGALQNLESADAAGDCYSNFSSLAVNGIGSILASCFGSTFPTTIYIGHPGWKEMGARCGYSTLNGIFIALLCFSGLATLTLSLIPLEAGMGILLWIGVIIIVQAFAKVPSKHMSAVAVGLFPAFAAWGLLLINQTLMAAGSSIPAAYDKLSNTIPLLGIISLERGFIFNSMILATITVFIIDREFEKAAIWSIIASVLSFFGIIHAFKFSSMDILYDFSIYAAPSFVITYTCLAILFFALHMYLKKEKQ